MSIRPEREKKYQRGRSRRSRLKSFGTKEQAEQYAKKLKLAKYRVFQPRHGISTKFCVVEE